jgi:hypothetical protein
MMADIINSPLSPTQYSILFIHGACLLHHPQFRHSNREILSNVPESTSSKRHHKIHFLPINVHLEYSTNDTFTGYFDIDTG